MTKAYTIEDPKGHKPVTITVSRVGNELNVDWTGHEPSDEAKDEAKRLFKAEFGDESQP
jgi:hypothetical protein